jgi:hypothetical protein
METVIPWRAMGGGRAAVLCQRDASVGAAFMIRETDALFTMGFFVALSWIREKVLDRSKVREEAE